MTAFLGVEASLTGRRWTGPSPEAERLSEAMAQQTGLPLPLARLLAARGVAPEEAGRFLDPQIRDLLPDPRGLRDMERAARRFLDAVRARQRIAVFADYDVDGGASAALLLTWLREMGLPATLYIPDRIDEGYGPNAPAMAGLAAEHDLIICVDCGTLSHDAIAAAEGADVLVLDHHLGGETLPPALAVVNPNRQDESGDLGHLCAAAVVFLMLVEANRQMREAGAAGPDLMAMLDLVALATVADVAPLVGVNRALVRQGLKIMARRERIGLAALADVARLDRAPTAYHLGYVLGPRVNAGGRIKLAGVGQRMIRGGAHIGFVIMVSGSGIVAGVLGPVYEALGLDFDPASVGSLEDELPGIGRGEVERAILNRIEAALGSAGTPLIEAELDRPTLEEAESRAEDFRSDPATGLI